jgi:hypothetical protein
MTHTPEQIAQIAKGLSQGMRKKVLEPHAYCDPNTMRGLSRRGLWDLRGITPKGQAVRTYLMENPQ